MLAYLLTAALWITLERTDGATVECTTDQEIQYFHDIKLVRIDQCAPDEIFTDSFELDAEQPENDNA